MRKAVYKLFSILPPSDKGKLALLFLLMLIAAAMEVAGISLVLAFISILADAERLMAIEWLLPILEYFSIDTPRTLLLYGSIALLGIFIVKTGYMFSFNFIQGRFIFNRFYFIADKLFQSYMNAPYVFHLRNNTAKLIRNITTEAHFLARYVMTNMLSFAREVVLLVSIAIFLLIVNPLVTLVVFVVMGGTSGLLIKFLRGRTDRRGSQALEERAAMIQRTNEGLGGLKEIRVMNRKSWFVNRFRLSARNIADAESFIFVSNHNIGLVMELVAVFGMLLITFILLWQGKEVLTIVSMLALFGVAIVRVMPSLSKLINNYNTLKYYGYTVDCVVDDLKALEKIRGDVDKKKEMDGPKLDFQHNIKLNGVSFVYPETSQLVLNNVSLTITKNTAVGLVGASGAGKTTIVDLILGLLELNQGSITVDGMDIRTRMRGWRKNIGYISQFIYLLDNTIRNNIALGLDEKDINEEQVLNAVRAAQLEGLVSRLPQGLDTMIGERGVRLSGGERQRVGIARALYHDPEVLIMDEATSSLDNQTERYIIEAIESLKKDRTIIIIAHRLATIKNCDVLHLLKNGTVVASGSYEELAKFLK